MSWPARASALTLAVLMACVVGASAQNRVPSDEARLLRQAAALESRGDFDGAEAALRSLLEQDPASSGGLFALERVLRAKGEPARILEVVATFLAEDPTSSGVRDLELRVLAEVDSLRALEERAEDWFGFEPGSEVPYREVARVFERSFGAVRALEVLHRGRNAIGDDAALALEIGDLHAARGDQDAAVDEWAKAVGDDGAQAPVVARRAQGLVSGVEEAGRRLVAALANSDRAGRRRAGVRIALDLGMEEEALDLAPRVARELDERARESFLGDVARRARDGDLPRVASWAYTELGATADTPAERRQFDQRMVDLALAAGDTTDALAAQWRVAESFTPGSVDRRRATAQAIRLERALATPVRMGQLLRGFRDEFPDAPELDDLAATVAGGLQARGDMPGAAAVLEGIEGPQSSLERAYLLLGEGDLEGGRRALLFSIAGLPPDEATEVIQFAGLLGRVSPAAGAELASAALAARRGWGAMGARDLTDAVDDLPVADRAPLLAEAARIADRSGAPPVAAVIRMKLVGRFPQSAEFAEATLALARYRSRMPDGLREAIAMLEDLIAARPNAAVVPEARLELERLRGRRR